MSNMFNGASAFNQDIDDWDVRNVENMSSMFNGAAAFNQDINRTLIGWNVESITDMSSMFNGASAFNQDIGDWNVGSVTDMSSMFLNASAFNQDIGDWDVSSVGNMTEMFRLSAFSQDVGDWDVSSVTAMDRMFYRASPSTANYDALLIGWSTIDGDETGLQTGVTLGAGNDARFCAGTAARTVLMADPGPNWTLDDGGQVVGCSSDATLSALSLSSGSLGETFDPATTDYTAIVAAGVTRATVTPIAGAATAAAITVNGVPVASGDESPAISLLDATTITIDVTSQDNTATQDYVITVTRLSQDDFVTTWQTSGADESITIPTTGTGYDYTVDWGDGTAATTHADADASTDATHIYNMAGTYVVSISGTFPRIYFNDGGDKDKIIAINQWGNNQVWTSMESAFSGASNLAGQATDVPNLSNVTNMASMFSNASSFNQDISKWDVSSVTDMNFMFSAASAL